METYYDTRKLNAAFWGVNSFIVGVLALWCLREVFPEWRGYQAQFRTVEHHLVWSELVDAAKALTGETDDRIVEAALRPVVSGRRDLPAALAELAAKHSETPYAQALVARKGAAGLREKATQLKAEFEQADDELKKANREFQETNAMFNWATDEFFYARSARQKAAYKREVDKWRATIIERQKAVDEDAAVQKAKEKLSLEVNVAAANAESEAARREAGDEEVGVQLEGIARRIDLGALVARLQSIDRTLNPAFKAGIKPLQIMNKVAIEQSLIENAGAETVESTQRCKTCHMGIDKPDMVQERWAAIPEKVKKSFGWQDDLPQVYRYHPRFAELFSNHPIEQFGCTTCHRGQGVALTRDSAHGRYADGEQVHHVERPAFLKKYNEAACARCHVQETEITGASKLNAGKRMFEGYGCVGCHEMSAFKDAPKIGPALEKIASKLEPEWLYQWIKDPRHFSPRTKMPNFFETGREYRLVEKKNEEQAQHKKSHAATSPHGLRVVGDVELKSVSIDDKDGARQAADATKSAEETQAIVSFLWNASEDWIQKSRGSARHAGELFEFSDEPAGGGDAARGEKLVQGLGQRGCVACHTVGSKLDDPSSFEFKHRIADEPGGRPFGPDLSFLGSKVKAGWLYRWLLDPKKYSRHARMPNLRLTEQEARDITAYLIRQKYTGPVAATPPRGSLTAKSLVAAGETLSRQYGCFGCHDIPRIDSVTWDKPKNMSMGDWERFWGGKDSLPPTRPSKIGADLSKVGVKAHHELDFGVRYHDYNQTVEDWLKAKIMNPRQFRPGRDIKNQPNQRMPNYHLDNTEADTVMTVLLSYTGEKMGDRFVFRPNATMQSLEQGRRILRRRNCVGCHIVDIDYNRARSEYIGRGGDLVTDEMKDANMAPPSLFSQGLRVNDDWLFAFLKSPGVSPTGEGGSEMFKIRPWLNVHMPTFGFDDEEVSRLLRYFHAADRHRAQVDLKSSPVVAKNVRPIVFELRQYGIDEGEVLLKLEQPQRAVTAMVNSGKVLFTFDQCSSCHPNTKAEFDRMPEDKKTNAAPPLGMARRRIRHSFISQWLKDPQWFQPGTNMPGFFGDLSGGYKSLEDNESIAPEVRERLSNQLHPSVRKNLNRQTEALRDYIYNAPGK